MQQRRILLADDDPAILALLNIITRRAGFEADTARDGDEAIRKIERNDYAVIFLDLMMPRLSGYEVIAYLARAKKRPVVIVSTAMNEQVSALDPDVVHLVVRKPFDVDVVGTLLAEAAGVAKDPAVHDPDPPAAEAPAC